MDDVDRLCALLDEETRLCGELTGVLRLQQQAVIGLRAADLLACLERREMLARALHDAGRARRAALESLGRALGSDAGTHPDLLPRLPLAPRTRVRQALGRLRGALTLTRSLERQTERLVGAGLAHVHELVRSLTVLVPGTRYGADAGLAAPAAVDRLDRRA